jgi:hypothetical protein
MLKIAKTDNRYTGARYFSHVVDVKIKYVPAIGGNLNTRASLRYLEFQTVRDWCIQTWGMSCERDHWLVLKDQEQEPNVHWCWSSENYDTKIYLATDKETNWFKLRWL